MTKTLILFLLLPLSSILFAQNGVMVYHPSADQMMDPNNPPISYVLNDSSPVRSCPGSKCKRLATLTIGTKIKVLKRSESTLEIKGIKSAWYKISSPETEGWIWGGNLARGKFGSYADPNVKFIAGYSWSSDTTPRVYQIIALHKGNFLDSIHVKCFGHEFGEIRNYGSLGLKIDDVIQLDVPCVGGCGCSAGSSFVFWDNKAFQTVKHLMGSADADYSSEVYYIFPADMEGIPHTVIEVSSYPWDEDPYNSEYFYRVQERRNLIWLGNDLVPTGKPTIIKNKISRGH